MVVDHGSQVPWYNDASVYSYANSVPVRLNKVFDEYDFLEYAGLTLPFAIVAICYKNNRVATDLFHWRKVHFRQIKSPFSPIMVQNLLTGDFFVNTCIQLCRDFQYWPDWVT